MKKLITSFVCLFIFTAIFCQPGRNDISFNSSDNGFGNGMGVSGVIRSSLTLSDGKILIVGMFSSYDRVECGGITRLNADGSLDTTFHPGKGVYGLWIQAVAIQSDGKILIGGNFTMYDGVTRNRIARLNADGSLDTGFNPGTGANNSIEAVAIQNDGKILIGGYFTTINGVARNRIARLNADGSLDMGFNPGTGANNFISSLAIQSDGKILIGGYFTAYNGVTRNRIARLNATGSLDTGFNPGTGANNIISSLAIQTNGKILIGGDFTTYNGVARKTIARLNTSGSLDTGFDPGTTFSGTIFSIVLLSNGKILIGGNLTTAYSGLTRRGPARLNTNGSLDEGFDSGTGTSNTGTGNNEFIYGITLQSDGKILVGGSFTTYNGITRKNFTRTNSDGSLDPVFSPGTGANGYINCMAIQPSGKVFISGYFTSFNGVKQNSVAMLNGDGTVDTEFYAAGHGNGYLQSILTQNDGKVLIIGSFTTFNGVARNRIVRLNANGSVDASFNPGAGPNSSSLSGIAIQNDGKILISGSFTTYNGVARNRIARLNADGSLDTSFDAGGGPNVESYVIRVQNDGKILIIGTFTTFNGVARNRIARLNADGSLDASFNPGAGANSNIHSLAIQNDGKILLGGPFTTFNGVARNRIVRLNADGSLDMGFDPGTGAGDIIRTIAIQRNGKILIGGNFKTYNGVARNYIARLNEDGALDASFNTGTGADGIINVIEVQSDDNILIAGEFTSYNGIGRNFIARVYGVGSTLAVSFQSIKAHPEAFGNTVTWQVQQESNIRHYEVEKSTDGFRFTRAGTVLAKGQQTASYSWIDYTPAAGYNYYRVKSIEQVGNTRGHYTSIVKVNVTEVQHHVVAYPNPLQGQRLTLQLNNRLPGNYKLRMINTAGQVAFLSSLVYSGGSGIASIVLPDGLQKGTYVVEIITPKQTKETIKVVY